jgi:hypothetical protein
MGLGRTVAEGRVSRPNGQVEKNVQDARHRLWQSIPAFESLDGLNVWLEQRCRALWAQTPHGSEPGTIADAWTCEVENLMPAGRPFDGFVEYTKRVSSTCLIHLERNRYSVPASFTNRPVSVRVYPRPAHGRGGRSGHLRAPPHHQPLS